MVMEEEFKAKNEEKVAAGDDLDPSEEGLEIDPAEFFDPEEFGPRRLHAHG